MSSCIDQDREKAQHSCKHSTKGLNLLLSLVDQAEGPFLGNISIHICSVWMPPAAGLHQSAQKLPLDPNLPSC